MRSNAIFYGVLFLIGGLGAVFSALAYVAAFALIGLSILIICLVPIYLYRWLRVEIKIRPYRSKFSFSKDRILRREQRKALRRWVEDWHFRNTLRLRDDEWEEDVNAWAEKEAEAWNALPAWARVPYLRIFAVLVVVGPAIFFAADAITKLVRGEGFL